MKKINLSILLIIILVPIIIQAQKTDLIRLENGDWVTGEIKTLQYGVLLYKTDGMSTVNVKWDHVTQIKSKYKFEVTLDKGGEYLAYIDTTSSLNEVNLIINSKVSFTVKRSEIVRISKIKDAFWSKFSGGFSFGLNYTRGSNILNYDLSGDLNYRVFKSEASLKVSSNLTNDINAENRTTKNNADLRFNRDLPKHWFYTAFSTGEQNSQLGLDLRMSLGSGFGRKLIYTARNVLQISANLVGNREWASDGGQKYNLEGLLYLEYRIFNNAPPKTKLLSYVALYPSLTEKGRLRTDFNIEGSIEIWNDFVYKLKYYYNSDNQPATGNADHVDWGVTTSFGYTF